MERISVWSETQRFWAATLWTWLKEAHPAITPSGGQAWEESWLSPSRQDLSSSRVERGEGEGHRTQKDPVLLQRG